MNDKPPAKSNSERQKEWRKRRKEQGYEMHTFWLEPDVADLVNEALKDSENKQKDRTKLINKALEKLLKD